MSQKLHDPFLKKDPHNLGRTADNFTLKIQHQKSDNVSYCVSQLDIWNPMHPVLYGWKGYLNASSNSLLYTS